MKKRGFKRGGGFKLKGEEHLQAQVADFMKIQHSNVLWFHPPNEGKHQPAYRNKQLKLGMLPGIPDVVIPVPRGIFCGFAMELKMPGNKPTANQLAVQAKMKKEHWKVIEKCDNLYEAIEHINYYLSLPKKYHE